MKKTFFGVIADETTDVSVEKKLNVVVQYYDFDQKRLNCELLDLVKCTNGTAEAISNSLLGLISKTNCDLNNVVGFSADTCNTMFGVNNSVSTILKKAAPNIVLIKCACHSIHLTSSYASKELPKELEELVYSVFNHFSRSPKRRETFESFQDFVDCAKECILRPSSTRWLTLQNAVNRIIQQYNALFLYFTDVVNEASASKISTSEIDILKTLRDPLTRPYLEFVAYALSTLNDFNTTFQAEIPLVQELKRKYEKILREFASNFMDISYVRETSCETLDPTKTEKYLTLEKLYLGKTEKQTFLFYNRLILSHKAIFVFVILGPLCHDSIDELKNSTTESVSKQYPCELFNSVVENNNCDDIDQDILDIIE